MLKPIYQKGNTITTYKIFCSKVKSKEDFFKDFVQACIQMFVRTF